MTPTARFRPWGRLEFVQALEVVGGFGTWPGELGEQDFAVFFRSGWPIFPPWERYWVLFCMICRPLKIGALGELVVVLAGVFDALGLVLVGLVSLLFAVLALPGLAGVLAMGFGLGLGCFFACFAILVVGQVAFQVGLPQATGVGRAAVGGLLDEDVGDDALGLDRAAARRSSGPW